MASPIFDRDKDHVSINNGTLKTPGLINFLAGPQWVSPIIGIIIFRLAKSAKIGITLA